MDIHSIFPDDFERTQELQFPFTERISFGNCCYSKHQYELLSILEAVLLGKYEFKVDEYGKDMLQISAAHFSGQTVRLVTSL